MADPDAVRDGHGANATRKMMPAVDPRSGSAERRTRFTASDRRNVLLCIVLLLLAVAATEPFYEMGFQDDWSYSHIARTLANTGQVEYNGWTAVMLLPQLIWSALFIRLFGFSFLIMRLSTAILGVLLIPVLYGLCLECGLESSFALFGTMLTVLSPLVLPMMPTFLSDVPAFFLFTLCVYGAVRSWKTPGGRACIAWGWLVALAGVLSGLDRQIYWFAPLLFLPLLAWIRRRERGAVAGLSVAWFSAIAAIAFSVSWFLGKPYILTEHILHQWKHGRVSVLAHDALLLVTELPLTAALILLPVLIAYIRPGFRSVSRIAAVIVLPAVLAFEYLIGLARVPLLPAMGNILTEFGVQAAWPGLVVLGKPPVVLSFGVRLLLTTVVCCACAYCGLALRKGRRDSLWKGPAAPLLILGLVFAIAWLPALVVRSVGAFAYDRYLIAFLPLVSIPLLRYYQTNVAPRVSSWSWAALAVYALYGVATAHDAFAVARARSVAAANLQKAGVPRTAIDGGFEYDGWTQLETSGYLNQGFIERPVGAFHPVKCTGWPNTQLWYAPMMPAVSPRYFVGTSRVPELVDGWAEPVGYTTWLPPARRQVFTEELPGGASAVCR